MIDYISIVVFSILDCVSMLFLCGVFGFVRLVFVLYVSTC